MTIRDRQADDDEAAQAASWLAQARDAVDQALIDLDSMRSREGDHLRADLDSRRTLGRRSRRADRRRPPTRARAAMEQRVAERVRELRTELQADETAVAQEIVRMAARSDISEEVDALPRPRRRTGWRWPTAPSRAAASSTSCCRR